MDSLVRVLELCADCHDGDSVLRMEVLVTLKRKGKVEVVAVLGEVVEEKLW